MQFLFWMPFDHFHKIPHARKKHSKSLLQNSSANYDERLPIIFCKTIYWIQNYVYKFYIKKLHTFNEWLVLKDVFPV